MRARIISMVVLAAALLVASPSFAQPNGYATFGGQWWSQTHPEAKFQEYAELPRGGFLESYLLNENRGPWTAAVWGNDAFTRNQGNEFFLARGVRWRFDGKYTETPHLINLATRTPYTQVAPGVFVLPDLLQLQNQTASGTNYNAGMRNVLNGSPRSILGIQTNVSNLRMRGRPIKDWQFDLKGARRDRQGALAYGGAFGMSNAVELPAAINQRMVDIDATTTYTHGPARVQASLGMSDFHNRAPVMMWDNPKALRDSVYWASGRRSGIGSLGRMAMWPDNQVVRGNAAFSVQLPHASTFTASLGVSRTTQEQDFIPLSANSADFADSASGLRANSIWALPATNLGGKVMTITQDYRLSGRPMANLFATLRAREERFDDQTEELGFVYGLSATDQTITRPTATSPGPVSEPWSHRFNTYGIDADYSASRYANVSLTLERKTRTHPLREVGRDVEDIVGGGVRSLLADNVSVNVNAKFGQRKMDDFDAAVYGTADRAALRRYDVADRDLMSVNGAAMWSPVENFDVSATGMWSKEDYTDTPLGLTSVDNYQFVGEGALRPIKGVEVTGGFGYGQAKIAMSAIEGGSVTNPAALSNPWTSDVDDKNVIGFASLSWWAKPKKLRLGLAYDFMRDMQENALADTLTAKSATTDIDMPNSFFRQNQVRLDARWFYAAGLELGVLYEYTKYDIDDALLQTVPLLNANPTTPTSAGSAIFLGAGKQSYIANRFQMSATRRF